MNIYNKYKILFLLNQFFNQLLYNIFYFTISNCFSIPLFNSTMNYLIIKKVPITSTTTTITLVSCNYKFSIYISILCLPIIPITGKVVLFTIPLYPVFRLLYSIKYNHNQIKKASIYPSSGPALYREVGLIPIARNLRRNKRRGQFTFEKNPLIDKWSYPFDKGIKLYIF